MQTHAADIPLSIYTLRQHIMNSIVKFLRRFHLIHPLPIFALTLSSSNIFPILTYSLFTASSIFSCNKEFRDALSDYFLAYPNMDYDECTWTRGDDPADEFVKP